MGSHRALGCPWEPCSAPCKPVPASLPCIRAKREKSPSSAAHLPPTLPSMRDTAITAVLSSMVPGTGGMAELGTVGAAHINRCTHLMGSIGAVAGGEAGCSTGAS